MEYTKGSSPARSLHCISQSTGNQHEFLSASHERQHHHFRTSADSQRNKPKLSSKRECSTRPGLKNQKQLDFLRKSTGAATMRRAWAMAAPPRTASPPTSTAFRCNAASLLELLLMTQCLCCPSSIRLSASWSSSIDRFPT